MHNLWQDQDLKNILELKWNHIKNQLGGGLQIVIFAYRSHLYYVFS